MDSHQLIQALHDAQRKAGRSVEIVFIKKPGAESVIYKARADTNGQTDGHHKPKIVINHP